MDKQALDAAADVLFAALEGSSFDAVLAAVTPDLKSWHNFDEVWVPLEEFRPVFEESGTFLPVRKVTERRRYYDGDKLIQQHVVVGESPDGHAIRFAGCMVLTVRAGRVAVIEEYVDRGNLLPATA